MLGELFSAGAKPGDLAAVAAPNVGRMLELTTFLSAQGRLPDALVVLDQADALGVPPAESLLARAGLQLDAGQAKAAAATVEAARALGVQDPRFAVLKARVLVLVKGAEGADEALATLDLAAIRYPTDMGVQLERIGVVTQFKKWNAASRSLEGFKLALYQKYGSATDAHIVGAHIETELGHVNKALDEYRIALADRPNDVPLWIEFARTAESGGRDATAREAFAQAARLSPNSPDIANAQRGLDARQTRLRALITDGPSRAGGQ
jgi:tetratricopeptide (TPR) repeat protein